MFVVIEWNEEFGQPSVADADVYDNAPDAHERAAWFTEQIAAVGRRERFTVARIEQVENDDE